MDTHQLQIRARPTVTVTILPSTITTACYYLNYQGPYVGGSSHRVPVGNCRYSFDHVTGYSVTPGVSTTTLASNETMERSFTYSTVRAASIIVNITGPSEARWYLDGDTANPHTNNWSVSVTGGTAHTITFSDVTGYTTPAAQTVTPAEDASVTLTGIYTAVATGLTLVSGAPAAYLGEYKDTGSTVEIGGGEYPILSNGTYYLTHSSSGTDYAYISTSEYCGTMAEAKYGHSGWATTADGLTGTWTDVSNSYASVTLTWSGSLT